MQHTVLGSQPIRGFCGYVQLCEAALCSGDPENCPYHGKDGKGSPSRKTVLAGTAYPQAWAKHDARPVTMLADQRCSGKGACRLTLAFYLAVKKCSRTKRWSRAPLCLMRTSGLPRAGVVFWPAARLGRSNVMASPADDRSFSMSIRFLSQTKEAATDCHKSWLQHCDQHMHT